MPCRALRDQALVSYATSFVPDQVGDELSLGDQRAKQEQHIVLALESRPARPGAAFCNSRANDSYPFGMALRPTPLGVPACCHRVAIAKLDRDHSRKHAFADGGDQGTALHLGRLGIRMEFRFKKRFEESTEFGLVRHLEQRIHRVCHAINIESYQLLRPTAWQSAVGHGAGRSLAP